MDLQVVIGPATVGGIQAGAFKIGDTAGTIDNIIHCKLYRPGSVGFVSKSVRYLDSFSLCARACVHAIMPLSLLLKQVHPDTLWTNVLSLIWQECESLLMALVGLISL